MNFSNTQEGMMLKCLCWRSFDGKIVELRNDVGVTVEFRDIEVYHRLFQKQSNNQLPKRTFVGFVNRRLAEYLISKQNITSTLNFNKLGFPRCTQTCFNANLCGHYKKLWGMCKEFKKMLLALLFSKGIF